MKRVTVCLGILLAIAANGYAQDSTSGTLNGRGQKSDTISDASPTNPSQTTAETQDHKGTATSGKQDDPQSSGRETHFRLGGIAVSAGYAHSWPGVYPYGFAYGPFYSPISAALWWDPFWGVSSVVYPVGYFSPADGKGEVRLNNAPKNASVYLNGGYAGTVERLKSFWLDPGVYDLVLAAPDGSRYQQRVYVLTGKTLKIEAMLVKPISEEEKM